MEYSIDNNNGNLLCMTIDDKMTILSSLCSDIPRPQNCIIATYITDDNQNIHHTHHLLASIALQILAYPDQWIEFELLSNYLSSQVLKYAVTFEGAVVSTLFYSYNWPRYPDAEYIYETEIWSSRS